MIEKFESVLRCLLYIAGIVVCICVGFASTHYVDEYKFLQSANDFKRELLDKQYKIIEIGDSIIQSNHLSTEEYDKAFMDMEDLLLTQL